MKLEYVFSGPNYLRLFPPPKMKDNPEAMFSYDSIIREGIKKVFLDIEKMRNSDGLIPCISIMYNAYAEADLGKLLRERNKVGFENLFADSGGLQVVTRGHELTEQMKKTIYENQSSSDFSMCFDEIPCESTSQIGKSSNRALTADKVYRAGRATECALKTASNIREQIETLSELNSESKVFYILQGNEIDDFVRWFETGEKILNEWHWDHIAGISLADTCIGNGTKESIDMMMAYHQLTQNFDIEKIKRRVHLLGVGSIMRMKPVLYLLHLFENIEISIDSTTASSSYVMKKFRHYGPHDSVILRGIVDYFSTILHTYLKDVNEQQIFETVYDDYLLRHLLSNRFKNEPISDLEISCYCMRTLSVIWKLNEFFQKLNSILRSHDKSPLSFLREIKNLEDYKKWEGMFGHKIKSSKIARESEGGIKNIEFFFV